LSSLLSSSSSSSLSSLLSSSSLSKALDIYPKGSVLKIPILFPSQGKRGNDNTLKVGEAASQLTYSFTDVNIPTNRKMAITIEAVCDGPCLRGVSKVVINYIYCSGLHGIVFIYMVL
jgi:hypothetical protein